MAWLDTTPEGEKLPRRTSLKVRQLGGAEVPELAPPPLDWEFEYLVDYLFEVGPFAGEHELSHQEIRAWQDNTGVRLDDFGALALKQMSRAYLGTMHAARKPDCPCPVQNEPDEEEDEQAEAEREEKLTAQLRATFMAMAAPGSKKQTANKGKKKS